MLSLDLAKRIVELTPDILDSMNIKYRVYQNRIAMSCPVHCGDNSHGCCIFTTGLETVGNWRCWTHQCEKKHGNNIIGFYQGVLSSVNKEPVSYKSCVDWLVKRTSYTGDEKCNMELWNFAKFVEKREIAEDSPKCDRATIRRYLKMPVKYYVDRGYKEETLDKYDVGLCNIRGHEMNMRIVVPVYNNDMKVVGCVGRTTAPKCETCNKFHTKERKCPSNRLEEKWAAKWINSSDFKAENTLYNMWYADKYIKKCGIAILVEGQGDVWRLEESNIRISLGMFKNVISDNQRTRLIDLGVRNAVILTDNDEAGEKGRLSIEESLERYMKVHHVRTKQKDIGDMSTESIRELLLPILRKL